MVASKTSIIVAAVALGAATAYAAPTAFNKDITLSRREADEPALIAREFGDDELYAREFYDDLDARDLDDLEARDFDDDELYARELYEDELEARGFDDDELEARDFEDYENLFARAVEATAPKNSTAPTPSSTATSSTSTPSSTSTGVKNDEHVVAANLESTPSTGSADEHLHDVCGTYVKAYEMLMEQSEHKKHEHGILHKHNSHHHHHHHHHRHRHHHRHPHHLSADKLAEVCGHKIAALVMLANQEHGKAVDSTSAHSTESKTLKVQTPTKAKRDLWARVIQVGESPQSDLKTPGSQNPDSSSAQSLVSSGTDGSALSSGSEKPVTGYSDKEQHRRPHGHHRHRPYGHHHHHHHHHGHRHRHRHSHHRGGHGGRQHGQQQAQSSVLDSTKSVTDTAVNSGTPANNGGPTPVSMSSASGEKPAGSPATPDSAVVPGVRRRSLGDDVYWKRSLAGSLGLDLDYFTKRFYDEDGLEY
ncbi:hypothetical protein APHAL10511_007837 [Amanita phalloides]|nr:hypothetical protein APHAL10511_007837 [Amanita phalloides]